MPDVVLHNEGAMRGDSLKLLTEEFGEVPSLKSEGRKRPR
jgi:hypothetical protein